MQCRCQICLFEAVFHTLVHTFQIVSFFFEFILSVTPVLLFSVLFPNFRSFLCNLSSPFLPPFYLPLSIFIPLLVFSSCIPFQYTMVQISQESRLQYWATRLFARTAHSIACSALLTLLTASSALICSLAHFAHSRACGTLGQ